MLRGDRDVAPLRDEATQHIGRAGVARAPCIGPQGHAVVATARRERGGGNRPGLDQQLNGIRGHRHSSAHGKLVTPSDARVAPPAVAASASRVRRWLMNIVPPLCWKPRSSVLITRRPSETLARSGLSDGSKASSVIEKSVTRTGTTRLLLQ